MSIDSRQRAEAIFIEAIDLPAEERDEWIAAQCRDDDELFGMVRALVDADEAADDGQFLEPQFLGETHAPGPAPGSDAVQRSAVSGDARFRVLGKHEKGGLGEVLVARDVQLNRDVAVKQIQSRWLSNEEARARFLQEAEVTGRLEHPGVVPVYAMGTWDDGRPYYAMRFIQGSTLKEVIARGRQEVANETPRDRVLNLRGLLNRFVDVCNTIEYAHSREVIHRDIKPSNIMIGPYGETLVVDWGLAKLLDASIDDSVTVAFANDDPGEGSSRTQAGGTVGTPQYMSPEQAGGRLEEIGIRTDVYLLGATLYQILTGQPPHDGDSIAALRESIQAGDVIAPRQIDSTVPPALEAICMKAMATETFHRYPSAKELSQDVERWLADEPVSIYRDPISVQFLRWERRHRTIAMSGLVAVVLLAIGSVVGSVLWRQRFEAEQQRNAKAFELQANEQQRLDELRGIASQAIDVSSQQIEANRYSAALNILTSSIDALQNDPELSQECETLRARQDRLDRIVQFYRLADYTEQQNTLSRDTQGIMASVNALQQLGVWQRPDWWFHLPDQDLTPIQRDQLRWDVYQIWMMLDGMLIKTIGTRLFGVKKPGQGVVILRGLRNMWGSNRGKREAAAALAVSDRVEMFRRSETVRWYRGIAGLRLGEGRHTKGEELGVPNNASDAHRLGILCWLSAMDSTFGTIFRDYQGQESLDAARDLLERSATLRPDHYWTLLGLAQLDYLTAREQPELSWRSFQPAIQAMERCITIDPTKCFAFADRSSLFRFQAEAIANDPTLDPEWKRQRIDELRRWSLRDAEAAMRLGEDQPWVGWQHGLALHAVGQTDKALAVFLATSIKTYPLMQIADSTLIAADDIRGRLDAANLALDLIAEHPDSSIHHTLYASIRLNQQRYDEAFEQIEVALEMPNPSPHAYAVRGTLHLRNEDYDSAAEDFRVALAGDEDHIWARYGLAACFEAAGRLEEGLAGFRESSLISETDEHRAACLLGEARSLGFLEQYPLARERAQSAQELQPASDILSVIRPLMEHYRSVRRNTPESDESIELRDFLRDLARLPRITSIDIDRAVESEYNAPLLNGGFELGTLKYWNDSTGVSWRNDPDYRARVELDSAVQHGGRFSLHVVGDETRGTSKSGRTLQVFPVAQRSRCRISFWARTKNLSAGGGAIVVNDRAARIDLPPGTRRWTRYKAEFDVPAAVVRASEVVPVTVQLVSAGVGEFWLDDFAVAVMPQDPR